MAVVCNGVPNENTIADQFKGSSDKKKRVYFVLGQQATSSTQVDLTTPPQNGAATRKLLAKMAKSAEESQSKHDVDCIITTTEDVDCIITQERRGKDHEKTVNVTLAMDAIKVLTAEPTTVGSIIEDYSFITPGLCAKGTEKEFGRTEEVSAIIHNLYRLTEYPLPPFLTHTLEENGGTLTQNPGPDTLCVVAERINVKVKNIISQKVYDVVHASWLIKCLECGLLKAWLPSEMLHFSLRTADKFAEEYDCFGDSYTHNSTPESLKEIFDKVPAQNKTVSLSKEQVLEIKENYFPDNLPMGLFSHCRVYLDRYSCIGDSSTEIPNCRLQLVELKLRLYGAQVTHSFDSKVTHVIFDESDLSRLQDFQRMQDEHTKQHFVSLNWFVQSIQAEKLLPERYFRPTT